MKPVLHGIGTLLKEGVTYSFRISSSVVSVLYYVRPLRVREARAPVYSSTYTHTHRASGIMYRVRRCKTYKFSTSLSVQWQQHIVMLLIAAQVVRRVN